MAYQIREPINAKVNIAWEQLIYNVTRSLRGKEVHTFTRGIISKMNKIARLEFKLIFYNAAVQHVSHFSNLIASELFLLDRNHHHHHHVVPPARISLNLSRHFSLSRILT